MPRASTGAATEDGAEIDLLFERGGKPETAIEIKRSSAPTLSRGFHSAREALKVKQSYLVHGGTETYTAAISALWRL